MSAIQQLSDADLDEVTGGSFHFVKITSIASNYNSTSQSQINIGIGQAYVSQGGSQSNTTYQTAIA